MRKTRPLRGRIPFPAASLHKMKISSHPRQEFLQNPRVAVLLPEHIRDDNARVRPADGAVHRLHVEVDAARRRDLRKAAVSLLLIIHVAQKFSLKRIRLKEEALRRRENLRVARPSVTLSRRAVRRDIERVVPCAPDRILHELIQQLIVAGKLARLLKIRADRDRLEIIGINIVKALHKHVLKAEDRKSCPVVISPRPARINDALQGRRDVLVFTLDISLRKFSVLIQHFPEAKDNCLPLLRLDGKCKNPRDILMKIKHLLPGRRDKERRTQVLLRADRHIVARRRDYRAPRHLRAPAVGRHTSRLNDLAVLIVRKADRSVAAPLPGPVRGDDALRPVLKIELQHGKKRRLLSVLVLPSPGAAASSVPAVCKLRLDHVHSAAHKPCHIDRLICDPLPVVRNARRHHKIAGLFPIDPCLIETAGRDIEAGLHDSLLRHTEGLLEAVRRIALLRVHAVIARDPLRRPLLPGRKPGLKGGRRLLSGPSVFVIEANTPDNARLRRHRRSAPDRSHGGGFDLPALP